MTVSSDSPDRIAARNAVTPLEGFAVECVGESPAAQVAVRHLRMLGASGAACAGEDVDFASEAAHAEHGSAGRVVLAGSGVRTSCVLDWAGPVDAPLANEVDVQAVCGIMHVHGRAAGRPSLLGVDYACAVSGVLAVHGLLAALIGRLRGGGADSVRTSVAQAALLSVGQYLAAATASDDQVDAPPRPGTATFTSADGVRFEIETFDPESWQRFWSLLGAERGAIAQGWRPFQHRYATATCPLPPGLHGTAAAHVFREAAGAAQAADVSLVRVRGGAGAPTDTGSATGEHPPWRIATDPAGAPGAPPPPCRPGAVLPLDGLVVVESTRRVQGPLAGHVLRLLGAEVIRVEPPGGDPMRGMPPMVGTCSARFLALNRGKHVVEIDLKSAAGQREVRELASGADAFLHNWAPGKAASFGLDSADLSAVRPGLVYAHASGWGRSRGAGDAMAGSQPLGTDFLVQAHSGLGALTRPHGEPPAPSLMTLTDVLGGLISAEGVLAGLLERCRGGGGSRVDSALYDGAELLTTAAAAGAAARRPLWGPLHQPLRTRDGYLALDPRTRAAPDRLARALGSEVPARAGTSDPSAAIVARCRRLTTAEAVDRLHGTGLGATPVCADLAGLAADPRFASALDADGAVFARSPWEFT